MPYEATYGRCSACATTFQSPMPGSAALAGFYPADYHSVGRAGLLTRLRHDLRARRLESLFHGDGAVLDYGCGDGSFLLRAHRRWPQRRLFGYEIGERREVVELENGAVSIVRGSLDDLLSVLPECSVITMNHVIEHLPDPLATLSALRARLATGGVLEGQTPAAGSLEQRVFGPRWSGYHAPRHTVVFSRQGLAALLDRAGFTRPAIQSAFNPAGLAISLATLMQPKQAPGRIERRGLGWLLWLGLGTMLAPVDALSGAPGIVNFAASRS